MELAQEFLVQDSFPPTRLEGVSQQPLRPADLYAARELFLCAGDTHFFPIIRLDGAVIGDGSVGAVTVALLKLLAKRCNCAPNPVESCAASIWTAGGTGPTWTLVPMPSGSRSRWRTGSARV